MLGTLSLVVDRDAYHADTTAVSHSMLEVFRRSIPLYHARFVAKTLPPTEPTPSMVLGTVLHMLLLEPDDVDGLTAVAPDCDRRTKAGKAEWAEFVATSGGKTVCTQDQWDAANRMADAIRADSLANELICADGQSELVHRWDRPGLAAKCRFDRLLDCGIVLDLKTSSDPRPDTWVRQAASFGYHRQAAWYLEGASSLLQRPVEEFLHVVVGNQPPHEVCVVKLDADAIACGARQNEADARELAERLSVDDWRSPWAGEIQVLSLPKYAMEPESLG